MTYVNYRLPVTAQECRRLIGIALRGTDLRVVPDDGGLSMRPDETDAAALAAGGAWCAERSEGVQSLAQLARRVLADYDRAPVVAPERFLSQVLGPDATAARQLLEQAPGHVLGQMVNVTIDLPNAFKQVLQVFADLAA
ncbi:hypothetical protein JNJ66_06050 [Candidatus Saccharibacteria bacterium]|nr:hypothetical protein [Candidatus Saccharibacteria bacterium]